MTIEQFSALVSIVVTLSAFGSSILTSYLTNSFQLKLKKLEFSHNEHKSSIAHLRKIYEDYILAASACVHFKSQEAIHDFSMCSGLALYYAPPYLQEKMMQLQKQIDTGKYAYGTDPDESTLLNEIILELSKLK